MREPSAAPLSRRRFVLASATGLLAPSVLASERAEPALGDREKRELRGKTLCGYQGWFNAQGDGRGLGFRHYRGARGRFEPGNCSIDLWPDVRELAEAERFDTAFRHADGRCAQVYSGSHPSTIQRHFEWMREFGIDGAAIQRFGVSLRDEKLRAHLDAVVEHAQRAAKRAGRSWMLMYDLSGLRSGEAREQLGSDWRRVAEARGIAEDSSYLQHEGRPLVAVWGVGFRGRDYSLADCADLIEELGEDGRFAVMLGVPYFWREQTRDAIEDEGLREVLRRADVLSPWSVGRYRTPEEALRLGREHLTLDLDWCHEEGILYLPVAFPGFSWHNLKSSRGEVAKLDQIPRRGGEFLWAQGEAARLAGAQALYLAMFDELDEGTALFKCTNDPPVGESPFLDLEGLRSDHYLWLSGEIARRLRLGSTPELGPLPQR